MARRVHSCVYPPHRILFLLLVDSFAKYFIYFIMNDSPACHSRIFLFVGLIFDWNIVWQIANNENAKKWFEEEEKEWERKLAGSKQTNERASNNEPFINALYYIQTSINWIIKSFLHIDTCNHKPKNFNAFARIYWTWDRIVIGKWHNFDAYKIYVLHY